MEENVLDKNFPKSFLKIIVMTFKLFKHHIVSVPSFYPDVARFPPSDYKYSRNMSVWETENRRKYIRVPLRSEKVGLWVAVSRKRILYNFFEGNVTVNLCVKRILMTLEEHITSYFFETLCWYSWSKCMAFVSTRYLISHCYIWKIVFISSILRSCISWGTRFGAITSLQPFGIM